MISNGCSWPEPFSAVGRAGEGLKSLPEEKTGGLS